MPASLPVLGFAAAALLLLQDPSAPSGTSKEAPDGSPCSCCNAPCTCRETRAHAAARRMRRSTAPLLLHHSVHLPRDLSACSGAQKEAPDGSPRFRCNTLLLRELSAARRAQKEAPDGSPTQSAHPARFSPDDKFSRERVECKKRFKLLPTQGAPLEL